MPIFEYRCLKCDTEFEKLVLGVSSEKDIDCPECKSRDVERIFSCFNGVSRSGDGSTRSLSSACSSCSASSCAGCKN